MTKEGLFSKYVSKSPGLNIASGYVYVVFGGQSVMYDFQSLTQMMVGCSIEAISKFENDDGGKKIQDMTTNFGQNC